MQATIFGETVRKLIKILFFTILILSTGCAKNAHVKENKIFNGSIGNKTYSIVNGAPVKPGQFPATVGLVDDRGRVFCTGSIIGYDFIMTAAHCVIEKLDTTFYIMYDCESENSCNNYIQVIGMAIHPSYRHNQRNWNDIAVLLLGNPIKTKNNIELLPYSKYTDVLKPGKLVFLVGYGRSSDHGGAGILRYGVAVINKISGKEIILGKDDVTKGNVCYGDSGSPLYVFHEGKQYIVGAASRLLLKNRIKGEYCGGGSIYTLDGPYQGWITRSYGRLLSRYSDTQTHYMQAQPFSRCGIVYSQNNKGLHFLIILFASFVLRRKIKCEKQ